MLEIYHVALSFVEDVAELHTRIGHHDPDLARQLRRSSSSVVLNLAEGMHAQGRSKTSCYNIALREMRECHAALQVSVRLRYLTPLRAELEDRIQRLLATLYRLSFPRRSAG